MTFENQHFLTQPAEGELSEAIPTALEQFNALTSPEGIASEAQRLHTVMSPFLDEDNRWDELKASVFNRFMVQKGIEFEEAGNLNGVAMAQAVRQQLYRTADDYPRYRDLLQEKPLVSIRMDDLRGRAILQAGESVPRPMRGQLFIPPQDRHFMAAYENQTRCLFMKDIRTQSPGTATIAVDRIVAVAAPFNSWTSGYSSGQKREHGSQIESSSAELIQDYATRPTEIPPLDQVRGLITSDGALYYLVTGGAHRAAAAIMKGQEHIETKEIVFQPINMNSSDIEAYS